jgi:hypothetical protein
MTTLYEPLQPITNAQYWLQHGLATIALLVLSGLLHLALPIHLQGQWLLNSSAILFASVMNGLSFHLINPQLQRNFNAFLSSFYSSFLLKLFLSLAFIAGVVLLLKPDRLTLVAAYMTSFFLTSGFEVYALLHNLRAKSK